MSHLQERCCSGRALSHKRYSKVVAKTISLSLLQREEWKSSRYQSILPTHEGQEFVFPSPDDRIMCTEVLLVSSRLTVKKNTPCLPTKPDFQFFSFSLCLTNVLENTSNNTINFFQLHRDILPFKSVPRACPGHVV